MKKYNLKSNFSQPLSAQAQPVSRMQGRLWKQFQQVPWSAKFIICCSYSIVSDIFKLFCFRFRGAERQAEKLLKWRQEREAASSRDDNEVAQERTSETDDKKAEDENFYYRYFSSISVIFAGAFLMAFVVLFLILRSSNPKLTACLLLTILIVFITHSFRMLRLRLKTLRRLAPKEPFVLFRVVLNADADKNSQNVRRLKTWTLSLRLKSYEEEE